MYVSLLQDLTSYSSRCPRRVILRQLLLSLDAIEKAHVAAGSGDAMRFLSLEFGAPLNFLPVVNKPLVNVLQSFVERRSWSIAEQFLCLVNR